ncbi:ABC transporter permease [Effusibacillus consociatus]|uniref:ABC transporter permease n=1 Tax=Effusibacillus consociatus TaxID=1117041 RepID=A0ABV9PYT8_9BACL
MNRLLTVFSNPVLVKEFRQRWRTPKTPLIITLYLLIMSGFIFFVMYEEFYRDGYIQLGQTKSLIMALSALQMGLIAFVAPGLSWHSERGTGRQTLNILLTTQLSPTSIVVSKLMTSVAFIVLLIVSTMPFICNGAAVRRCISSPTAGCIWFFHSYCFNLRLIRSAMLRLV